MVPAGLPRRSKDEVLLDRNFRQEHLMSRSVKAVIAVIALLGTWQLGVGANGIPVPKTSAAAPRTPEERAVVEYNRGLDSRNRGAKAEAQAAKSSKDSDRVKHEKKALEETGAHSRASRKPRRSTRNCRTRGMAWASPSGSSATQRKRWPATTGRSSSLRTFPTPSNIAAKPTWLSIASTMRSRHTSRCSRSIGSRRSCS